LLAWKKALENSRLLPQTYLQGFAGGAFNFGAAIADFRGRQIYPQAPWFLTPFNLLIRNTTS
jgi:hypothetical protein